MSRARKLQKVASSVRRRRHAKSDPTVYRCNPTRGLMVADRYRDHDLRRTKSMIGRVCARCGYVWAKPR